VPNDFDDMPVDRRSFAYRDLLSQDRWESFTVSASLTVVGTPTYSGRFRVVGRQCFFQVSAVSTTSIATTAGTSYFALPMTANGIGGVATMTNDTTNIAVGVCHVDVSTSRVYPPTQGASGNTFVVAGWYEV
jgi:hypothetical protein